jgi:DinB family protein
MTKTSRPAANEYAPPYAQYISLVPGDDVLSVLGSQLPQITAMFSGRSERDGNFRYAPDKWSVKEVVGHLADTERIMAYRALCIARGDQTPIPGFEQDDYVRGARFSPRKLDDLVAEFTDVRMATLAFFRSLDAEAWGARGVANKNEVTVRALAFIIAGHVLHHRRVLEERYFPAIPRA